MVRTNASSPLETFPRGLKPNYFIDVTAGLKSRPFKTAALTKQQINQTAAFPNNDFAKQQIS
jgi:hypothetical protein